MKKCNDCHSVLPDEYKHCNRCGAVAPEYATPGGVFLGVLKGLFYVALYFAVQIAVASAGSFIVSLREIMSGSWDMDGMLNTTFEKIDLLSIISAVVFIVILLIVFSAGKRSFAKEVGLSKCNPFGLILLALVLGLALNFVSSAGTSLIPFPQSMVEKYENIYSYIGKGNPIIEVLDVAIIAPIAEEIVFRGLLYSRARRVLPASLATLISAVVFGIAHGNFISFTYTFVIGVVLAILYEESGSLIVPIALHIGFNSVAYLVDYMTTRFSSLSYLLVFFFAGLAVTLITFYFALTIARRKKDEERIAKLIPCEYLDINAPDESLFRKEDFNTDTENKSQD